MQRRSSSSSLSSTSFVVVTVILSPSSSLQSRAYVACKASSRQTAWVKKKKTKLLNFFSLLTSTLQQLFHLKSAASCFHVKSAASSFHLKSAASCFYLKSASSFQFKIAWKLLEICKFFSSSFQLKSTASCFHLKSTASSFHFKSTSSFYLKSAASCFYLKSAASIFTPNIRSKVFLLETTAAGCFRLNCQEKCVFTWNPQQIVCWLEVSSTVLSLEIRSKFSSLQNTEQVIFTGVQFTASSCHFELTARIFSVAREVVIQTRFSC